MVDMPFCPKCGAEIPSDAAFCPNCGSKIAAPTIPPVERRYEREKSEKGEKHEKREKEEKYEKGEKSKDWTGPIIGGLILIWLGITFYIAQMNYISWAHWWAYFIFGLGIILIVQAGIRYATPAYKGSAIGSFIGGLVLMIIGLSGIMGVEKWWPLILIAIGIIVIVSGVIASKRTPKTSDKPSGESPVKYVR